MRLTKSAVLALIGCLLAVLVGRSTWAADCAANDERIDYAGITFCIPKASDLYRHTSDQFGLQFVPQTFVGDRRVPSELYSAAKAPVDRTYVTVSISAPVLGQAEVRRYERLKQSLTKAIDAHPRESAFEDKQERGTITFRRLDESTVVASTWVAEDTVLVLETWLHLDGADHIEHMVRCEYFVVRSAALPDLPMECTGWFPVGTSIAKVQLSGGKPERSYRLSRQIRDNIEGFIKAGTNP